MKTSEIFNSDYLVASENYSEAMSSVVLPALKARETQTTLSAKDGTPLYCVSYNADSSVGTVLVLHGFTENAYKYSELIYSLLNNGFSVVAYDQRGHGRSGRVKGLSDSSVTHVDRFEDYVDDLSLVCGRLLAPMPKPHLIFSHSMGGAVAALYMESHPETFAAAFFCAPMIAPNTSGVPVFAASAICGAARLLGRGDHRPFFIKPWHGPEDFATSCATDPARFAWYDAVKTARDEFHNSVPTYQWTSEAVKVTRKILAAGAPEKIPCPVMLSTAEHDFSVMPDPQKDFIGRVPHGKHVFVSGARHEIFRSTNDVFFPWWHDVLSFFRSAVPSSGT